MYSIASVDDEDSGRPSRAFKVGREVCDDFIELGQYMYCSHGGLRGAYHPHYIRYPRFMYVS